MYIFKLLFFDLVFAPCFGLLVQLVSRFGVCIPQVSVGILPFIWAAELDLLLIMEGKRRAPVMNFSFGNLQLWVSEHSQKWAAVEIWIREPLRSIELVRWEVNGMYLG